MTRTSTVAFRPRNRLSEILSGADRRSFAEHVASAEEAVHAITPILIGTIADDVSALARLCCQEDGDVFGQCREIGRLALGLVETARLARRPGPALVAKGIWEMIDALTERGVWHTDALRVHVDALGALISVAEDGPRELAIARELARLRETIGAAATS